MEIVLKRNHNRATVSDIDSSAKIKKYIKVKILTDDTVIGNTTSIGGGIWERRISCKMFEGILLKEGVWCI